ncbi:hypothetical protein KR009_010818, partial [Drosophila setifemur]
MSNVGKIRLKTLTELQDISSNNEDVRAETALEIGDHRTPEKKRAGKTRAATTTKKTKDHEHHGVIIASTTVKRSSKKTPLPGQMRIDSFFKSSSKNYKLDVVPPSSARESVAAEAKPKKAGAVKGRKRLFDATCKDTGDLKPPEKRVLPARKAKGKENTSLGELDVIDLCSEGDSEQAVKEVSIIEATSSQELDVMPVVTPMKNATTKVSLASFTTKVPKECVPAIGSSKELRRRHISIPAKTSPASSNATKTSPIAKKTPQTGRKPKKSKPCPPYKVVEGTNFCVDGFQFGEIAGVTHYFLTHYHADHYIGLTRKFSYPLYMSPTTARLVRTFIKLDEMYINEIDVDQTIVVDNVEVTAIEANHCPGALMFFFKLSTGECILHTGDFRASSEMESLPIFWNHTNINLLYLDTTYMNKNYDFCHQTESVDRAVELVRVFFENNPFKRILVVCGAYVIGKEKIWMALAEQFALRVWTEPNRRKAVGCLQWPELEVVLTDDPREANLHVIGMGKVSYPSLVEYFMQFEDQYDMLLGIRPSGWEKNSKPSYGKKISTIGIEYSEHSSYKELERFVRFLKPKRVISTVPVGRDLFVTGDVPSKWYKFKGCATMLSTGYQPSISTFLTTPKITVSKVKSQTEMILSPVKEYASGGREDDDMKTVITANQVTILSSTTE